MPGRRGGVWIGSFALWSMISVVASAAQNATLGLQNNSGQAEGFKIAGTVVNAVTGAPLTRVKVSIAATRARAQRIEMITGEGGHFEFTGVPAGKYSLQGAKRGYITSSCEQHEQYSTAIVTGPEFATDKLVLRLMPMGMITGHVLDESGEGVRDAHVRLFLEDHSGGVSRVRAVSRSSSDDRGYFDFNLLRPGTYFVSVSASPWYAEHPATGQAGGDTGRRVLPALDVAYPTTYYGGGTESDGAAPIELRGGQTQDVEIRLTPVPALRFLVRVPVETGDTNVFRHPVLQKRVFDSVEFVNPGQAQPVSPGVLEVTGVAAGRYDVSIRSTDPAEVQRFAEIDLEHDGQDLNAMQSETLARLTVKLRGEGILPKEYGVGLRDARQRTVAFAQGDANGQVSFEALRPGKYAIVVVAQGKMYAVSRTISAGETAGHEVNVASGATEVIAELVEGVVGIEGVVEKKGRRSQG